MGPPPLMREIRGWVSIIKKVSLEGLYGRVSLRGFVLGDHIIGAVDSHRLEGSKFVGSIMASHESTTLDVATIQDN